MRKRMKPIGAPVPNTFTEMVPGTLYYNDHLHLYGPVTNPVSRVRFHTVDNRLYAIFVAVDTAHCDEPRMYYWEFENVRKKTWDDRLAEVAVLIDLLRSAGAHMTNKVIIEPELLAVAEPFRNWAPEEPLRRKRAKKCVK